ncbi:MAG: hypothetical protein RIF36_22195 [Imperialibacter sp.]|uniref:hypothetical protein n=1 Tax=Imperialibacter sp. TaxID=2038411 RepID=UPI0032ED8CDB
MFKSTYFYKGIVLTFILALHSILAEAQTAMGAEPARATKPLTDWLLDNSAFKADVYQGQSPKEIAISNGLIRRTFRLAPNAATVGLDNLITGESLLRGVKPEAEITIDGITYAVGGLKGQPNYAYLRKEWIDQLTNDQASLQFTGYEVSEPKAPFEWKQVRHHTANLDWPPKGVHLRMDYRMPLAEELVQSGKSLPSDFGRKQLTITDFKALDAAWKATASKAHPRSLFVNEGKVGEIYTPRNTSVFVERSLTADVHLVEATIDPGTDQSGDWAPGLAVVYPNRIIKFSLTPGGHINDQGRSLFSIWDGEKEIKWAGERVNPEFNGAVSLRIRWDESGVYCEAKLPNETWQLVERLAPQKTTPASVRVGKMDAKGQNTDSKEDLGELVRLHVTHFAAYGDYNQAATDAAAKEANRAVKVSVHYELYDGIPVMAKWITIDNQSKSEVTLDRFTSEIIAAVEDGSAVEARKYLPHTPNIHVETDMAFASFDADDANHHVVHWGPDPEYNTQVNYLKLTPCLLKVSPEVGPGQLIAPGKSFTSFRTFVMLFDSYDRERKGLAQRKMYRTLAPWTTENPLMMHARFADWERVKVAIDQAAEVGFEMVILTFGSGFDIENNSPDYLAEMKKYADYAKSKGVEIGGYSLLASRKIGNGQDVVMPEGMTPTFGNSPCIGSEWGEEYFQKLYNFYQQTGFTLLEHDGSYPGDVCTSHDHPGHRGYEDSQWNQYQVISKFYQWCRSQGIYLNVPDYYYLAGSNKSGMGYREVNWSLPRAQQLVHTRQNIYDGSWVKQSSMGWMFVPLTEYHGGGAAATIEPLNEHLDHYEGMITSNLGGGVQACYRGPRLYDTEETKTMVKGWVDWYKAHRSVLEGDIIHLRRPDGRDIDYWLNVDPMGEEKGLLSVYNPLDVPVKKEIYVPLYYTGLSQKAVVSDRDGVAKTYDLDREYGIRLQVEVPANGFGWYLVK